MANLFSSQTPTLANVNEAANVTVSTTHYFTANGTVTGGRFYGPTTVGAGTFTLVYYRIDTDDSPADTGTGTLLGTVSLGTISAGVWNTASFSSGISVTTGTAYRVGVRSTEGRYAATGGGFNSAGITNGSIVAPQTGTNPAPIGIGNLANGAYIENVTSYPNKTFNGNMYFVDVEFTESGDVTPPSVPTNLATTAIAATTADLSWTASTDNVGVTQYELIVIGP